MTTGGVFSSNEESIMMHLFSALEMLALELFRLLAAELFCEREGTSKDFDICCVRDFANSFLRYIFDSECPLFPSSEILERVDNSVQL